MKLSKISLIAIIFSSLAVNASDFNGYIVKFKKDADLNNKAYFNLDLDKVVSSSSGTYAKVTLDPSQKSFQTLEQNPDVEYVEPNWIVRVRAPQKESTPVDVNFNQQWGLKNIGSNSGSIFSPGVAGEDINAAKAWEITKGSKSIKVAVIDTGVDYTHPDLNSQMDVNVKELNGTAGVDDDNNGFVDDIYGYDFANKDGDPMDGHSHGTHCAGVIGAAHDGKGTVGVMADVKIVALKFMTDEGSGETIDAIAAIDYAISRGVKVMSNSWGGDEESKALEEAIERANQKGIVFVAAAGNDSADNDTTASFPANHKNDNVISVGSHEGAGKKSSFSNFGRSSVHVFAPGSNILSTTPKGRYQKMSGTSMATPHVAGVVGLLLSREPNLSPVEVRERLIRTSVQSTKLNGFSVSGGRIDAYRALRNR